MNYSILVNSCDKYEETWYPFFSLFFKYWEEELPPVYLNTENLKCLVPKVNTLNSKESSWSSRLLNCLDSIKTKYVILLLDDFFMMDKIRVDEIHHAINLLETDSNLGGIYFKKIYKQDGQKYRDSRYILMDKNTNKYFLNFQASVFNVDVLRKMIIPGLSPWDIEEKNAFNDTGYLLLCDSTSNYLDCKDDVFPYLWALQSGYGICKSKWLWNNKKLLKKNDINFHRKQLGYMTRVEYKIDLFIKKIKDRLGK